MPKRRTKAEVEAYCAEYFAAQNRRWIEREAKILGHEAVLETARSLEPRKGGPVALRELRRALRSFERQAVDAALIALHHDRKIILSKNDDALSITEADRSAALSVGGSPRHLLYLP